jgi:plastocyanin
MYWKDRLVGFAGDRTLRGVLAVGLVVVAGGVASAANDARIMIDNFKFAPIPLTVAVGSTITLINRDDIPHSIVVPALGVRSPPMDTDETFVFRADKPGTYDYICGLHPFMHGQIVVR